jgi:hypothetical protein
MLQTLSDTHHDTRLVTSSSKIRCLLQSKPDVVDVALLLVMNGDRRGPMLAFIAREVLRMFYLVCGSNLTFTLLGT